MLIIPAARAAVSKELAKDGLTQAKKAKILGTTQAAISKYLNGDYSSKIKAIEKQIVAAGISKKIAVMVLDGATSKDVSSSLDGIARQKAILKTALRLAKQ